MPMQRARRQIDRARHMLAKRPTPYLNLAAPVLGLAIGASAGLLMLHLEGRLAPLSAAAQSVGAHEPMRPVMSVSERAHIPT